MRPGFAAIGCVLLGAAVAWLVFETRHLAELTGVAEADARQAHAAARELRQQFAAAAAARDASAAQATRLEAEVATTAAQLSAMADTVRQRAEHEAARAAAAEEAEARALQPMPEGVRSCLTALHECLRAEGYSRERFLSARALDGDGLHGVELLVVQQDGFGVDFVRAGRMVAGLDRSSARLVLRFFDGYRTVGGERVALPAEGHPLVFAPIDGRLFEARLPVLLRVEGAYPEPDAGRARPATDLDPITRLQWLDRFDRLLARAGTAEVLRVNRCRGLADGCFLDVQVLGTDGKHRLLLGADCARLCVEVDRAAGVVSLWLRDGILRRGGVESTITAEGYRMLLPEVTPQQATEIMLGMVVTK
ncbi:MAG: hypothetical protein FJ265_05065 [Planctomycetes bacterium]|nr:hypothetical protein [Planctomycetota bacterium]